MMLSRLYRLNEAQETLISSQEVERRYPEAMVYFDRDIASRSHGRPSFFMQGSNLLVNINGGGWWHFISDDPPDNPHWKKTDKPSRFRGGTHRDGEENIGPAEAERFFPGAITAFRAAGFNPDDVSFDTWNGMLVARMWDLGESPIWSKKTRRWEDLPGEIDAGI